MKAIDLLPEDPVKRLEELILDSWRIFVSEFVHGKYEIVKEASFQLHFAGVMKQLAVHYELANDERIKIELEKPIEYQFKGRKGAIDIVLEYSRVGMAEMIWIPIELKFRKKGDAADLTVAEIYEDIISLEQVKEESNAENQIPYAFFFCISTLKAIVNPASSGFNTKVPIHDGYCIEANRDYYYVEDEKGNPHKTGMMFYEKNGPYRFKQNHPIHWEQYKKNIWFLKLKI